MASDSTWLQTVTLLHFNGGDAGTTFTDSSLAAKTFTGSGNAQIDTGQSKWGGSSLQLDGTGDYISTSTSLADFRFGTGDFTVEAWIRTSTGNKTILDFFGTNVANSWQFFVNSSGYLEWWSSSGTAASLVLGATSTSVKTGSWVHVAACRSGTTLRLFADGTQVASGTDSRDYSQTTVNVFAVGAQVYSRDGAFDFNGHIDDVRIKKGTALYTGAFTPPSTEFPDYGDITSLAAADGPLGTVSTLGAFLVSGLVEVSSIFGDIKVLAKQITYGIAAAESMLGSSYVTAWHDFYTFLSDDPRHFYTMQLQTSAGTVRVPISSWQASLHVEDASFVQCVVPAADQWVDELGEAESFVIFRKTTLIDGREIEAVLANAPLQTLTFAKGGFNSSATLQGYLTELAISPNAPATPTLRDVQTVFTYADGIRVRCAIDWQLRPGMTCYYGTTPVVVEYINYYVTQGQAYMDVGGT